MWTAWWPQAASTFTREKNERHALRGNRRHSDPTTTPADLHVLADTIPCARYAELAGLHLFNIEDSDRFTAEVSAFLADGGGF